MNEQKEQLYRKIAFSFGAKKTILVMLCWLTSVLCVGYLLIASSGSYIATQVIAGMMAVCIIGASPFLAVEKEMLKRCGLTKKANEALAYYAVVVFISVSTSFAAITMYKNVAIQEEVESSIEYQTQLMILQERKRSLEVNRNLEGQYSERWGITEIQRRINEDIIPGLESDAQNLKYMRENKEGSVVGQTLETFGWYVDLITLLIAFLLDVVPYFFITAHVRRLFKRNDGKDFNEKHSVVKREVVNKGAAQAPGRQPLRSVPTT